jgi:hypothetical protein
VTQARAGGIEAFRFHHPGLPVALHDYAPEAILRDHLRSADVHLVSLLPTWEGTMVPSKSISSAFPTSQFQFV